MPEAVDFSQLAEQHTLGDRPVPAAALRVAAGEPLHLMWRNELGGLTTASAGWRVGARCRPCSTAAATTRRSGWSPQPARFGRGG